MPKRKGMGSSGESAAEKSARRVRKPTKAEEETRLANLAKGRKKRADRLAADPDGDTRGERWAKLLSGTITVKDLTDEELERSAIMGKGGMFAGASAPIPSHIAQQMSNERMRRYGEDLKKLTGAALKVYGDILTNGNIEDLKPEVQARVAKDVLDRIMGKAPETVHVINDDPWGALMDDALDDDRDLAEFAAEARDVLGDGQES